MKITGIESIDNVVSFDQSPIGKTPRSNPVTYTGFFSIIRDIFALTSEAKKRGYTSSRFSFNVEGGRCESCRCNGAKESLDGIGLFDLKRSYRFEQGFTLELYTSRDSQEARDAFVEKRDASFEKSKK